MKKSSSYFRRSGSLLAASFVLALCCAPARADIRPYYNNLNQPTAGTCGTEYSLGCAQRFQTGQQDDNYLYYVSVPIFEVAIQDTVTNELTYGTTTLSLYSDDAINGGPLAVLAQLMRVATSPIPQGAANGTVQFDALGIHLQSNSSYWMVLTGTGDTEWEYTTCSPTGDGTSACPAARTPGDAVSAVSFAPDSWFLAEGTQKMEVNYRTAPDETTVPEPSSVAELLGCLAILIGCRRMRKSQTAAQSN